MISQIDLIAAIAKHLERRERVKMILPRQLNAIIAAADSIIAAMEKPYTPAVPGMGLAAWYGCDDVGASSQFMAATIHGGQRPYAHPHDADDFSRCHKFMEAVTGTRELLPKLSAASVEWALLVAAWPELTELYLADNLRELTLRIQDIEARTQGERNA